MSNRAILVILDGWGLGPNPTVDAIAQANTPYFDSLMANYPHATLTTFGEAVGLPEGQMGNSEVGHLNIGAGRVVYQELARINVAVRDGSLAANPTLLAALDYAKTHHKPVHLMGLVSDGGVHSHLNHLLALTDIVAQHGVEHTYIHAFTDGRDTDPRSAEGYLHTLLNHIEQLPVEVASVVGRYYAMDRDKRWERIKLAYDLLVHGQGEPTQDLLGALTQRYAQGETDEFILPLVHTDAAGQPLATIAEGDVLICFNFRTDRPRQISEALTQRAFPEQGMTPLALRYLTMSRYDETYRHVDVLFEKKDLTNTMGEVLAAAGKTQVRIAETEKYPHVTFFFSGGREEPFPLERRIMIPSPQDVATYDLRPEMGAYGITDAIVADMAQHHPDFICLNFANTDMVGHTGVFEAAMRAAEVVDECLGRLIETALLHGYEALIIADHGNSDYMINPDGSPNTAHSMNPVPCIFVSPRAAQYRLEDGKLADVAPTLLWMMGVAPSAEMDGKCLVAAK